MSSLPVHIIFEKLRLVYNFGRLAEPDWYHLMLIYNLELESRQPEPYLEYDQDGNVIVNEVIGYTEKGEEIWT